MLFCTQFTYKTCACGLEEDLADSKELTSGEVGKGVGFRGGVKRDVCFFALSSVSQLCFPHLFPKEPF